MIDYIEREAALNIAFEWCPDDDGSVRKTGDLRDMLDELEAIPAADVRPVVRGKNIGQDYDEVDQFVCSECGIELQEWVRVDRDEDTGGATYHEYRFNFCPNCGADMREE